MWQVQANKEAQQRSCRISYVQHDVAYVTTPPPGIQPCSWASHAQEDNHTPAIPSHTCNTAHASCIKRIFSFSRSAICLSPTHKPNWPPPKKGTLFPESLPNPSIGHARPLVIKGRRQLIMERDPVVLFSYKADLDLQRGECTRELARGTGEGHRQIYDPISWHLTNKHHPHLDQQSTARLTPRLQMKGQFGVTHYGPCYGPLTSQLGGQYIRGHFCDPWRGPSPIGVPDMTDQLDPLISGLQNERRY